jgi:hypothetical protein
VKKRGLNWTVDFEKIFKKGKFLVFGLPGGNFLLEMTALARVLPLVLSVDAVFLR